VRAETARVYDALGYALVVEVKDLFAEVEIFERSRAAPADLQRILVVGDRCALLRGERGDIAAGDLVRFAALAPADRLLPKLGAGAALARLAASRRRSVPRHRSLSLSWGLALRPLVRRPEGAVNCK
jgi:hypothetical protein